MATTSLMSEKKINSFAQYVGFWDWHHRRLQLIWTFMVFASSPTFSDKSKVSAMPIACIHGFRLDLAADVLSIPYMICQGKVNRFAHAGDDVVQIAGNTTY